MFSIAGQMLEEPGKDRRFAGEFPKPKILAESRFPTQQGEKGAGLQMIITAETSGCSGKQAGKVGLSTRSFGVRRFERPGLIGP